MPDWAALSLACAAVALAAWAGTGLARALLVRFAVYDRPTPRSSHSRPTPRGAGFALVPVLLTAWWVADRFVAGMPGGLHVALAGALVLFLVSARDDLRPLPPTPRFAAQILMVGLGLAAMGPQALVFQGLLPPLADSLAAGLLWLWFVNLFNFMDGIDGLSGVELALVGLGLSLVAWAAELGAPLTTLPLLAAGTALGFLVWNWAPARIFLGDAGSVPLGYLLGWLLLQAAAEGEWAAAVILPLYYLADATLTLLRRAWRREKVWQAHREHLYQRAVQSGLGHARVAGAVAGLDAGLVGLAVLAASGRPWPALAGALLLTALFWMAIEWRCRRTR